MSNLKLRNTLTGDVHEFSAGRVRCGRHPESELVVAGPGADVVSSHHAVFGLDEGQWWVEDMGSRNGTYVTGERLAPDTRTPVRTGDVIGFGVAGPRFEVETDAVQPVPQTVAESAGAPGAATMPMARGGVGAVGIPVIPAVAPPAPPEISVVIVDRRTGDRYAARGPRLRIGRGRECELRPMRENDALVSRVHAEITISPEGTAVITDLESRNGTFVNGEEIDAACEIREGTWLVLGRGGPELKVEELTLPPTPVESPPPPPPAAQAAPPPASPPPTPLAEPGMAVGVSAAIAPLGASTPPTDGDGEPAVHQEESVSGQRPRRSFGGRGRTQFLRQLVDEATHSNTQRVRRLVWVGAVAVLVTVVAVYVYGEIRVRQASAALEQTTAAFEAQRAVVDSIRAAAAADIDRLRGELGEARAGSAPAAVVDSLRAALTTAEQRTRELETSLERTRSQLAGQLADADSQRAQRLSEIEALQRQLTRAVQSGRPRVEVDSLQRALTGAQQRAADLDRQLRAVRGVDLAAVAQANQGAVGLVTAFVDDESFQGSGFVVNAAGYFVTNRHVVMPEGRYADSLRITMADQRTHLVGEVVRIQEPPGPDLAILRVRDYRGPYIVRVDWNTANVGQGEPAALIGFPAGRATAVDRSAIVRTSMSAGIFSKVSPDRIEFDGFTVAGSSGSPIFNALGEVVAVHRAGLREAVGLSFAVPIRLAVPLLPPEIRAELGLAGP